MAFAKCPWCGGEARVEVNGYTHGNRKVGFQFEVQCGKCRATKKKQYSISFEMDPDGCIRIERDDMIQAEKDWNTRVVDFGWKDGK